MPSFFCSPLCYWIDYYFNGLGGSTKATIFLAVRKCCFSRSEFLIKIAGFCSRNRTLFCCPIGRFSIALCRTEVQGDFTLWILSNSDTSSTSKLLSVTDDAQLLCQGYSGDVCNYRYRPPTWDNRGERDCVRWRDRVGKLGWNPSFVIRCRLLRDLPQ